MARLLWTSFVATAFACGAPGTTDALPDAGAESSTDAGAVLEGAAVDVGIPPPSSSACPTDALFCESFESGVDETKWKTNGDAKAFVVDSTVAADGKRSLHLAYGKPYGHLGTPTVEIRNHIPIPEDRVYLRAYMRFGDLSLPGAHPFFVDVSDPQGNELGFASIINDFALGAWSPPGLDAPRIWYEGQGFHSSNEDGDSTPKSENGLVAEKWFCLEMMFFGDDKSPKHDAEEVRVWIDGTEISDMHATDAIWTTELGHAPPLHWSPIYDQARWRFGVESFGPKNVALDIWFDAIALSKDRIGCLPK